MKSMNLKAFVFPQQVFYFFAIIGMEVFGGKIVYDTSSSFCGNPKLNVRQMRAYLHTLPISLSKRKIRKRSKSYYLSCMFTLVVT